MPNYCVKCTWQLPAIRRNSRGRETYTFLSGECRDITIINESTSKSMGKPQLQSPSLIAHSASGDRIMLIGQRNCSIQNVLGRRFTSAVLSHIY
ncbi:unnamed protein product [Haemonchus placei]|uniref:Uncharacterized protein n=1 Tax=Haemonchus placei TaxID=6290 RepID=A0A0N4VRX5_HAEPC|nr:unnamed protein product [Haemonchus placei]